MKAAEDGVKANDVDGGRVGDDIEMNAEEKLPVTGDEGQKEASPGKQDEDMNEGKDEEIEASNEEHLSEERLEDQAKAASKGRPKRNAKKPNREMP